MCLDQKDGEVNSVRCFRVIDSMDPMECEDFETLEEAKNYVIDTIIPALKEQYMGSVEWEGEPWVEIVKLCARWDLQVVGKTEPDPEADPPEEPQEIWDIEQEGDLDSQ